jgi:hypothetical protein
MTARLAITVLFAAIVATSCGGTASGTAGVSQVPTASKAPTTSEAPASAPSTGAIDCSLVSPTDFATVGVDGAGAPTDAPEASTHYCVYSGTSGATGGIEFDVFPEADIDAAKATYQTVIGEGSSGAPPTGGTFDEASFAIDGDTAYLAVRQGRLVFALAVPNDINTEAGLVALANLIIERAGAAASE